MKLSETDDLKLTPRIELLAPWPGGVSLRQSPHDNEKLLHRTSDSDNVPDLRYWTAYDHFVTDCEARAERAAFLCGLLVCGARNLATALAGLAGRASPTRRPPGQPSYLNES